MTLLFRHFAVLALFVAACGRAELDISPFDDEGVGGSRSGARAGASSVAKGGQAAHTGGQAAFGGTFSMSGTPAVVGGFGTGGVGMGGMLPIGGTFGPGGTFPIAGSENGEGGAAGSNDQFAVRVAAGLLHVCALGDQGGIKCWGAGDHGALGYGNATALGDNEMLATVPNVSVTNDGQKVTQVVAGGYHTCVRLMDGTAKCWGENSDGQLGYGDTQEIRGSKLVPAELPSIDVSASPGVKVNGLCAGERHTCAVLSDLSVKCWGSNSHGQLGYGNGAPVGGVLAPAQVEPVALADHADVSDISCGANHTCVLLTSGKVQCWGSNVDGQLGLGNVENIGDDEEPESVEPISVDSDPGVMVKRIAAGNSHTCALLTNQTVRCWGAATALGIQASENIGDDELPSAAATLRLSAGSEGPPVDLSAGSFHTCALLDNGTLKCWGQNHFGELGQGNLKTIGINNDPAAVPKIAVSNLIDQGPSSFVAGNFLSCAIVPGAQVNEHAASYCWGWNEYGQLGRGNTITLGDDELPSGQGPLEVF